ncbi:hypothetical protein [Fodinicola feengrottensis]
MTVAFVSACSSAGSPAGTSSRPTFAGYPPSAVAPSPTQSSAPEQAALSAWSGLWAALARSAEIPDYDGRLLDDYATGDALTILRGTLQEWRREGIVTKGRPVQHPQAKSVSPAGNPTTVTLTDCGDSTTWLRYYAKTGDLVAGEKRARRKFTATVNRAGGGWRVSEYTIGPANSC